MIVGAGLVPARIAEGNDVRFLSTTSLASYLVIALTRDPGGDKPRPYRLLNSTPTCATPLIMEEKLAAGGVVVEAVGGVIRVLLVHRPRYDDWSFPKGGVHSGESLEEAALREVLEETGVECRVERKLSVARYNYRTKRGAVRPKAVHYFLMQATGGRIATDGVEVDHAEWLDVAEAQGRLSYDFDKEMLARLIENP
ncbi:MAG TPA: NUDIX hydrolase [Blastocatellia bacterium]|nr:NUDIX hydrolase [Blastocatellia bacterium]